MTERSTVRGYIPNSMHRQPMRPDAMNTNTRLARVEERAKFEQRFQRDANVMIRHIVYDKDSAAELAWAFDDWLATPFAHLLITAFARKDESTER